MTVERFEKINENKYPRLFINVLKQFYNYWYTSMTIVWFLDASLESCVYLTRECQQTLFCKQTSWDISKSPILHKKIKGGNAFATKCIPYVRICRAIQASPSTSSQKY